MIRLLGSKLAVSMDAPPDNQRGFFIADKSAEFYRPQFGKVIAHGPDECYAYGRTWPFPRPGTEVLVGHHDEHGTTVQAETLGCHEVRVYGAYAAFSGEPQECYWWDSVFCGNENGMWKPYGENLFIQRDDPETVRGGLYLPDTIQRKQASGIVIGVGALVDGVSVGEHVCFDPRKCQHLNPQELEAMNLPNGTVIANVLAVEYVKEDA